MAEQADRVYKRRRITIQPSGDTVDIPVVCKATFVTAADQYQEHQLYFDNTETSSRNVHTHRVSSRDGGSYIDVERIDSFFVRTMADQAQESKWILANTDPPPIQLTGNDDPAHQTKHYVRYFKDNDPSKIYVDCELIDQLSLTCAADQYQEYRVFPLHADQGDVINDPNVPYRVTKGFCDPSLPLLEGDPPWRIDPLQNVVNVSAQYTFSFGFSGSVRVDFFTNTLGISGDVPDETFSMTPDFAGVPGCSINFNPDFQDYLWVDPNNHSLGATGWVASRLMTVAYNGSTRPTDPIVFNISWPSFTLDRTTHGFFPAFTTVWTVAVSGTGFNATGRGDTAYQPGSSGLYVYTFPGMSGTVTLTPTNDSNDQHIVGWDVSFAGF